MAPVPPGPAADRCAWGGWTGLAALDEGEFDKAYQLLSRARHAAESLGDAVEGAAQIRQGAAEAEIFVRLVPDRLESILDTAGRADTKEWPARFATLYKGRSIIVDAHVIAVHAGATADGPTLVRARLPDLARRRERTSPSGSRGSIPRASASSR